MPKKGNRPVINMACTDCRSRNYTTAKNRQKDPQRLELRKFCPTCRGHRVHREVR